MVASSSVKWAYYDNTADLLSESDLPPQDNGDAIMLISSTPGEGQSSTENKSDLCLVGYYLAYRPTSSASTQKSYNLYRYFKSSNSTWISPTETMAGASIVTQGLLGFIQTGSTDLSKLLYDPPSPIDGVLAHNVINFEVKAYDKDLNDFFITAGPMYDEKPDIIEISMTVFNQETAQKFATSTDWHVDPSNPTPLQAANAHTFHLRVPIK
jgi:hypothetical protein